MKVGPSGSAIRSLIPSHRGPLWSKATVVSAAETSGRRSRQARLREASASEPSMKCRKRIRRCQNRGLTLPPESARGNPEVCPSGIRHVDGAKLNRALVWNVRTCRTDAKGEVSSGQNREDESTDAEHRGGVARSRDEGFVMGLDRRACVVQPRPRAN